MQVDVLGPLRVRTSTGEQNLPGGLSAAALCWLVVRAGRPTEFSWLASVLWPNQSSNAAPQARMLVRGLVPVLEEDALLIDSRAARLVLTDDAVDAWRFERLLSDADGYVAAGDRPRGQATIAAALQLWRGDPYPELHHALAALDTIHSLVEGRLTAIEQRIALVLAGAEVDYWLVAELQSLVMLHGERPRLRHQLSLSLYLTGRQIEALDVLRETRREFGDVDGAITQLELAILRHDPALSAGSTESDS